MNVEIWFRARSALAERKAVLAKHQQSFWTFCKLVSEVKFTQDVVVEATDRFLKEAPVPPSGAWISAMRHVNPDDAKAIFHDAALAYGVEETCPALEHLTESIARAWLADHHAIYESGKLDVREVKPSEILDAVQRALMLARRTQQKTLLVRHGGERAAGVREAIAYVRNLESHPGSKAEGGADVTMIELFGH